MEREVRGASGCREGREGRRLKARRREERSERSSRPVLSVSLLWEQSRWVREGRRASAGEREESPQWWRVREERAGQGAGSGREERGEESSQDRERGQCERERWRREDWREDRSSTTWKPRLQTPHQTQTCSGSLCRLRLDRLSRGDREAGSAPELHSLDKG